MTDKKLDWAPDLSLPAGKGATVQRFTTSAGTDGLEIDTTPWGEGDLKVNGRTIAHVSDASSAGDAFQALEPVAEKLAGQTGSADRRDGSGKRVGCAHGERRRRRHDRRGDAA